MKALKIVAILILAYVSVVVLFESMLGYFQPENQSTLVITTTDEDGISTDRVLVRNVSNGKIYVSANHWPRAWYHDALENPNVQVYSDGAKGEYLAVAVTGEEHHRVDSENPHGIGFNILVGFAPRYFFRLDPR